MGAMLWRFENAHSALQQGRRGACAAGSGAIGPVVGMGRARGRASLRPLSAVVDRPWRFGRCNPGAPTNKILPDIPCSQELVGVRTRASLALGQISASASITTFFRRFLLFAHPFVLSAMKHPGKALRSSPSSPGARRDMPALEQCLSHFPDPDADHPRDERDPASCPVLAGSDDGGAPPRVGESGSARPLRKHFFFSPSLSSPLVYEM